MADLLLERADELAAIDRAIRMARAGLRSAALVMRAPRAAVARALLEHARRTRRADRA